MRHIDGLMMGTQVRMTFQSTPHHREDAEGNRDAVELQRFAAWHWAQVPLKLGSYAALVLLHVMVLGSLRGAALGPGAVAGGTGAGRWQWSGAVLGPGAGGGRRRSGFSWTTALCSMRRMNE
jgi:hypothetical protein